MLPALFRYFLKFRGASQSPSRQARRGTEIVIIRLAGTFTIVKGLPRIRPRQALSETGVVPTGGSNLKTIRRRGGLNFQLAVHLRRSPAQRTASSSSSPQATLFCHPTQTCPYVRSCACIDPVSQSTPAASCLVRRRFAGAPTRPRQSNPLSPPAFFSPLGLLAF